MNALSLILLRHAQDVRGSGLFVMEKAPVRTVSKAGSNASVLLAFVADQSGDLMENVTAIIRAIIALPNAINMSEWSILID